MLKTICYLFLTLKTVQKAEVIPIFVKETNSAGGFELNVKFHPASHLTFLFLEGIVGLSKKNYLQLGILKAALMALKKYFKNSVNDFYTEVKSTTQGSRPRTQKKFRGQGRGQTLLRPKTGKLEAKTKKI